MGQESVTVSDDENDDLALDLVLAHGAYHSPLCHYARLCLCLCFVVDDVVHGGHHLPVWSMEKESVNVNVSDGGGDDHDGGDGCDLDPPHHSMATAYEAMIDGSGVSQESVNGDENEK